jgi:hypothetical protein
MWCFVSHADCFLVTMLNVIGMFLFILCLVAKCGLE